MRVAREQATLNKISREPSPWSRKILFLSVPTPRNMLSSVLFVLFFQSVFVIVCHFQKLITMSNFSILSTVRRVSGIFQDFPSLDFFRCISGFQLLENSVSLLLAYSHYPPLYVWNKRASALPPSSMEQASSSSSPHAKRVTSTPSFRERASE